MRALFLGRFQPPHRGHLHALRAALQEADEVLVGVGSAQHSHEPRNPFTVGERFDLLHAAFTEARLAPVYLFPLPDLHRHRAWVDHVRRLLPPFDCVVTNNPLSRRLFGAAGYRVVEAHLWRPEECSGRRIRARWSRGADASPWLSPAVAAGVQRLQGPQRVRALLRESGGHGRRFPA